MTCERCNSISVDEAVFRVRSDIIDLKVCCECAKEARDLRLHVKPLAKGMAAPAANKAVPAAA